MVTRISTIIILILFVCGCASRVEVQGVEVHTLMNGRVCYYALTDSGEREVSQRVYENLVYKLNHLPGGQALICDMEKSPATGIYDVSVCASEVVVLHVIDTGQDVEEHDGNN